MRTSLATRLARAACGCFAAAFSVQVLAQPYPSKSIRLVTQFSIGAPGDVIVRTVAAYMSEALGQQVVVENRTGASGLIAARAAASAAPDGYTIAALAAGVPVIQVVFGKDLPLDPSKDLTPITRVAETLGLIVAHPSVAGTLSELISAAKVRPGKIFYGTTGVGSQHHLAGEQINLLAGVNLVHVPYKSTPLMDTVSGALPLTFLIAAQGMPPVTAGKVKALAVVGNSRIDQLPGVPTVGEVIPGFEPPPGWNGLFGPAGLPVPVLQRLHAAATKAMEHPQAKSKILALAHEPMPSKSPEEFSALIRQQIDLVARVAKSLGARN